MQRRISANTNSLAQLLTAIMVSSLLIGCAKTNEGGAASNDSTQASSSEQVSTDSAAPVASTDHAIAGVWLGEATMDENLLQAKLDQLTPAYQESTIAKAKSFLSTAMAVDFKTDGSVESEVEIVSLEGQIMRDGSKGAWRVVEQKDNEVLIETQENLSDGTVATNQARYRFISNDQVSLVVPVCEELNGCGARLIFTRQQLDSNENVAQGDLATEKR